MVEVYILFTTGIDAKIQNVDEDTGITETDTNYSIISKKLGGSQTFIFPKSIVKEMRYETPINLKP